MVPDTPVSRSVCIPPPSSLLYDGPAMKNLVLPQLLLLLLSFTVAAQSTTQESKPLFPSDLNSKVTGTNTTYLELLRRVIPDLETNANDPDIGMGHKTIPIKHLSDNSAVEALEGDIKLETFVPQWIKSDGRRVLLLDIDLSAEAANQGTPYEGESNLLAAFVIEPSVKLLDAIDMKTDRFSGFWDEGRVFHLTAQSDAFVVDSSHSNAGESYEDITVLFLNRDRFETITNMFILNTQGCGATFTETPSFRAQPGSTKYPNVLVTVKVKKEADPPECDHRTGVWVKTYQAVYQWNAAKGEYRTTSPQLRALDRFNRHRM